MQLVFTCPKKQQVFRNDDYRIFENRGVTVDGAGNKRLDMKVELASICPFCGERHVYDVNELACPLICNPT